MIPLRMRLAGFLSYREPTELDFTGFDLACISGSNGAGKSTLLDAITWVLFGQARRRDDTLINNSCSAAEVTLDFAYEGNIYRVQRSKAAEKSAMLEFFIQTPPQNGGEPTWRSLTEHTLRDSELRIQQVLRMDYETFTNASFFLQGKADQFAEQRPGDRKRILSSILGLDAWETYRERAAQRRKIVENEVATIDGALKEIEAELSEEPQRVRRLEELSKDLERARKFRESQEARQESLRKLAASLAERRKMVDALQMRLQEALQRHDGLKTRLDERQTERDRYRAELARSGEVKARYAAWQAAREELARLEEVAQRFRDQEKLRQEPLLQIERERAALQQEIQSLRVLEETVDQSRKEIPAVEERLRAAQAELESANAQVTQRTGFIEQRDELLRQQAEARAENPRLKSEMDELKARIDQLEAVSGAACPTCGQPLEEEERLALVASLREQGKTLGDSYRVNQALLKDFDDRQRALDGEVKRLAGAENEARQAVAQIEKAQARLEQLSQQVQGWEESGAPRLEEVRQTLEKESYAREGRARLAKIDKQLKAIGYDAEAHDAVRREETAGRGAEEELRRLESASARLDPLEREIAGLQTELGQMEGEIGRRQNEADEAAAAYAAEEAGLPDLDQAERELMDVREQENRLRGEVGAAKQRVDVLDVLRARQAALREERTAKTRRIGQLKTLERAFGKDGVPALLIEQALPEIEINANEILDRLSGGRMTVSFATLKSYRDKKREDQRETLDILISDGGRPREYELFSGGEAFRVNFAIRLALSKVLARRAGARLQTLVIDEGFGSQDAEGRQRLVEAINLVQPDFAKILVITHLEELKDVFPSRIEVEKTEHGSSLRVL
jgi:exonuclease SbcC